MKKIPAILFFIFICWIIFLANTDRDNWIIDIGHAVKFGDKIGHFMLYGILAFLTNWALSFRYMVIRKSSTFLGSLVVLGFSIVEEFTQLFLQHRNFDFTDIMADVLGIALFSWLGNQMKKSYSNRTTT